MLKCVLLRKLNFTNAQSTSFRQHCGAVSETFLIPPRGAFCCLFFKYLDTRNSYRSFQGGTLTTLSELGFHSLTCHCDQSLRMVFRWRTRDLLPAPPQTGSRHFFLSGCVLARLRILVNSLAPLIPQWLSTKPLGWSVTYTFNS